MSNETDRELMELAARAAGQERSAAGDLWSNARGMLWDPLTDDGDALRLAVKLGMEVYHADDDGWAAYASHPTARGIAYAVEQYDQRPNGFAATRRAIVRAAAEIGRAMR